MIVSSVDAAAAPAAVVATRNGVIGVRVREIVMHASLLCCVQ